MKRFRFAPYFMFWFITLVLAVNVSYAYVSEQPMSLPPVAVEAIEKAQGKLSVSVKLPDGSFSELQGNGFLVHEDGWFVSVTSFLNGTDILAHDDRVTVQSLPAYPFAADYDSGLTMLKLKNIPSGVHKTVFAANIEREKIVYMYLYNFFTDKDSAVILKKVPFQARVVDVVTRYNLKTNTPIAEYVYIDRQIPSFFVGGMVVDGQGNVVGIALGNDGGWGILVSAKTVQKFVEEALSVYQKQVSGGSMTIDEQYGIEEKKRLINEVVGLINSKALERPKNLVECVVDMIAVSRSGKCLDGFSHFERPQEAKRQNEDVKGEFGGIGLELTMRDNYVVVISPIEGTPAERAKILAGDIIIGIDGVEIHNVNEAVGLIRGAVGTDVEITILRKDVRAPIKFKLTREKIKVFSIKSKTVLGSPPVGVLTVSVFNEKADEMFPQELQKFADAGIDRVVINLRNNPGGLLDVSLRMLALFMKPYDTALVYKARASETVYNKENLVKYGWVNPATVGKFLGMKVVILVNKGSASASEIFAGTMKDWGYTVVGEGESKQASDDKQASDRGVTFGKGVGQTVFPLSDGSTLSLTTFEFLVGNNRVPIRDKGVKPSIKVGVSEDASVDLSLEKAIEILRGLIN